MKSQYSMKSINFLDCLVTQLARKLLQAASFPSQSRHHPALPSTSGTKSVLLPSALKIGELTIMAVANMTRSPTLTSPPICCQPSREATPKQCASLPLKLKAKMAVLAFSRLSFQLVRRDGERRGLTSSSYHPTAEDRGFPLPGGLSQSPHAARVVATQGRSC